MMLITILTGSVMLITILTALVMFSIAYSLDQ